MNEKSCRIKLTVIKVPRIFRKTLTKRQYRIQLSRINLGENKVVLRLKNAFFRLSFLEPKIPNFHNHGWATSKYGIYNTGFITNLLFWATQRGWNICYCVPKKQCLPCTTRPQSPLRLTDWDRKKIVYLATATALYCNIHTYIGKYKKEFYMV